MRGVISGVGFGLLLMGGSSPAMAQQAPAASPALERIASAYGQCIGAAERQADAIGELQRQNAALQKQVAELTAKPAAPPEPPK